MTRTMSSVVKMTTVTAVVSNSHTLHYINHAYEYPKSA